MFPALSQTFVLHEFLELRRQGAPVRLIALARSRERLRQPEAEFLLDEVRYVRRRSWRAWLPALLHVLRRHPIGLARAVVHSARHREPRGLLGLLDAVVLVQLCSVTGVSHLHAHSANQPARAAHLAWLISGLPYSLTAHAVDLYVPRPEVLAPRVAAARAVVTCSASSQDYLQRTLELAPGTVRLLRHGLPLQAFASLPRAPVEGRLVTVARLVEKKGLDVVAAALAQLVADGRDLHWHLIGSGAQRAALEQLVERLGLSQRVRFLGEGTSEQVREQLSSAFAFVLAPRVLADGDRDGIPNAILEAMASGVPVVATAVSGVPEVVRDGETGLLVEPEDPRRLADAIARLLDDPALRHRLAAAARAWALEHCDLTRCVAPLTALLTTLAQVPPNLPRALAAADVEPLQARNEDRPRLHRSKSLPSCQRGGRSSSRSPASPRCWDGTTR